MLNFTWAHLGVIGLAADIAGAIVLGLSFSAKQPAQIRAEVPKAISSGFALGALNLPFPQKLAESMIHQRAEARLGLVLLVGGFCLQGANLVFNLGSLTTSGPRYAAIPAVLTTWLVAYVAWLTYVPWDARKTERKMDALTKNAAS